jgi:hypothetical protein
MYNGQYVSIKQIASKIKRGKLYKDVPFESIIDYTVDAMRLIMAEKYFVTKPGRLKVENHKTKLPCGFELMIQSARYDCNTHQLTPMRYGTDNFHSIYHVDGSSDCKNNDLRNTYTINNSVITTSFKEGEMLIAYKAIQVDEEGYPMIPDNVNVQLTVEYYIKHKYLEDMASDEAFIQRRQSSDEQLYCWYVGKAQSAATNMTMDELESFANSMSQLFTNTDQFKDRLKDLGLQEYIKIH